jgi:hypothetical protein
MGAPSYWLAPITAEERKPHGCFVCECNGAKPLTFPADGLIAVGFGYAAVTKDGREMLREPDYEILYDDDGEMLPEDQQPPEQEYPTGADAEALAVADPDHDWRIHIEGPLSGRTYQRQGVGNWVLVEQNEGFA